MSALTRFPGQAVARTAGLEPTTNGLAYHSEFPRPPRRVVVWTISSPSAVR